MHERDVREGPAHEGAPLLAVVRARLPPGGSVGPDFGFGVEGLRFRVYGLWFMVHGSWFMVWG